MSIPKTAGRRKHTRMPWWNAGVDTAIKKSKHALYILKRHKNEENLSNFKKARSEARKIIEESKKESWTKYVSSITNKTPYSEVWNKIKRIRGSPYSLGISMLETANSNEICTEPKEIATILVETFAKNSSNENYDPHFLKHKIETERQAENAEPPSDPNDQLNIPITFCELQNTLLMCNNSSPGPDGIPNALPKNLPLRGQEYLLGILNHVWMNQTFPQMWKEATVIPIPKPGKDHRDAANYRPIALTCTMCKIMEKIINKRLDYHVVS